MTKRGLFVLNMLLWGFASSKILQKGIPALIQDHRWWVLVLLAIVGTGFVMMFNKVSTKYSKRIDDLEGERFAFWKFMSPKGYVLIAFMMTLGILTSRIPGMPTAFFASFYNALGSGLAFGALKYLARVLKP